MIFKMKKISIIKSVKHFKMFDILLKKIMFSDFTWALSPNLKFKIPEKQFDKIIKNIYQIGRYRKLVYLVESGPLGIDISNVFRELLVGFLIPSKSFRSVINC